MSAYAVAHLRNPNLNDEVLAYIERIQGTMDPFGGRFLVHNTAIEVVEGDWPGTIVIIEFPAMAQARAWYDSAAYQEILPLRTRHILGEAILVDGVAADYDASLTARNLKVRLEGPPVGEVGSAERRDQAGSLGRVPTSSGNAGSLAPTDPLSGDLGAVAK